MKQFNELIKEWSDKLSMPQKDIEKDYQILLAEENDIHKDLSEEDKNQRALSRLALLYKKQLRSPATGFEGFIIGMGDCVDIVAKQKRDALEKYKNDPQQAILQGIVDEQGIPLDTRKEWAGGRRNSSYGKPLPEHNYLRNIIGIAINSKNVNDIPKVFTMNLSGDKAKDENLPIFQPVRFMAIDKTPKENTSSYVLNPSSFTTFNVDNELKIPEFETLLKITNVFVEIKDLAEYHLLTKDNFNRFVITEGSVSSLRLEPTSIGSRIMNIEDETLALEDIEANNGITCWIPSRINIDFAEGSKVLVVGRTSQGKKRDDMGNLTDELSNVTINTFGIYAIPKYKIELPEVEEITEENI